MLASVIGNRSENFTQGNEPMDDKDLHERGLKLRIEMFGRDAVEKRMNAFGEFGKAAAAHHQCLCLWRCLEPLGPAAGDEIAGHDRDDGGGPGTPTELRVHLKGALKNGCTPEQIQEILLLLTMYCGIPAANQAHTIATEVLREQGSA